MRRRGMGARQARAVTMRAAGGGEEWGCLEDELRRIDGRVCDEATDLLRQIVAAARNRSRLDAHGSPLERGAAFGAASKISAA